MEQYQCEECEHKATDKSDLMKHVESIHRQSLRYNCDQCEYDAESRVELLKHMKAIHEQIKRKSTSQWNIKDMIEFYNTKNKRYNNILQNEIKDITKNEKIQEENINEPEWLNEMLKEEDDNEKRDRDNHKPKFKLSKILPKEKVQYKNPF